MDNKTSNNIGDTVSIRRPPRVWTDDLGRTVWMGQVDSIDLQLLSDPNFDPYDSATEYHH